MQQPAATFGGARNTSDIVDQLSEALTSQGIAHDKNRRIASYMVPIVVRGRFCHVCIMVDRARLLGTVMAEVRAPKAGSDGVGLVERRAGKGRVNVDAHGKMGAVAGALKTPTFFIRYNPDPWRMTLRDFPHSKEFEKDHHDAPFKDRINRLVSHIRCYCMMNEKEVVDMTGPRTLGFCTGGLMSYEFMYATNDANGAPEKRSRGGGQKRKAVEVAEVTEVAEDAS